MEVRLDKAGQEYWDDAWSRIPNAVFQPHRLDVQFYRDRLLAGVIRRTLGDLPKGARVLEAGCADSTILVYVASELGFRIAGLDYSPKGCERFRARIAHAGITAEVECCDLFEPPVSLRGHFDALLSFGLVEHFSDTAGVMKALASFVRPGGRILTLVPNLQGVVGFVQRLVGPSIYKVHEVLSPAILDAATRTAGLDVIEADYMLPVGFGALNYNEPASPLVFQLRRLLVGSLARLSFGAWFIDERFVRLPKTASFSPYSYCIAQKRVSA